MTRSAAPHRRDPGVARRARICTAFPALALALLAGCATNRSGLPAARTPDAASLRAEAQAAPADPEPLYQLALLHYGGGDPEAALQALRGALSRDREYVPALTLLAKLLHESGRSAEGLRWFAARAPESWPEPVRLDLALLYADTGNTVQARRLLESVESGPWADAAAANLAYLDLLDGGDGARLARVEARFRDVPEVLNNLALVRLRAGDAEGAAHLLHDVTIRFPDFAPAHLNLALVLQHYLFDEDAARTVQAHCDALTAPHLADAAIQQLLDSGVEDTAPAVREQAPGEAAPPAGTQGPKP